MFAPRKCLRHAHAHVQRARGLSSSRVSRGAARARRTSIAVRSAAGRDKPIWRLVWVVRGPARAAKTA
eukprot:12054781-Alexandrium_andersonii.AAC.1